MPVKQVVIQWRACWYNMRGVTLLLHLTMPVKQVVIQWRACWYNMIREV